MQPCGVEESLNKAQTLALGAPFVFWMLNLPVSIIGVHNLLPEEWLDDMEFEPGKPLQLIAHIKLS